VIHFPAKRWKTGSDARQALLDRGVPAHRIDQLPPGAVIPIDDRRALIVRPGELWLIYLNVVFDSEDQAAERAEDHGDWAVFSFTEAERRAFGRQGRFMPTSPEREWIFQRFVVAALKPPP